MRKATLTEQLNRVRKYINLYKREAITELLEQHKKDRAKVVSKCDLINMSTVEKYLRSLD